MFIKELISYFSRNNALILFIYGLSIFLMGFAILMKLRPSKLMISKALPWLAAFGILHGIHEWLHMFEEIYPNLEFNTTYHLVILFFLITSTASLLTFGTSLIYYLTRSKNIFILYGLIFAIYVISIFLVPETNFVQFIAQIDNFARHIFYSSGLLLSGIALILEYNKLRKEDSKIAKYFLFIAIIFFVNVPFAGLLPEPTIFYPANLINNKVFLKTFFFPVELIRAIVATLIAIFVIRALSILDFEEEQKLKELRDREKSALDKSEYLAKQYSLLYQKQKSISGTLQKAFLPRSLPNLEEYNIGVHYRSATIEASVGGDFYDFIEMGDRIYIIMGDISGKGITAATEIANAKSILRYILHKDSDISKIMTELNRALFNEYKAAKFISAILISYDINNSKMTVVNAGHPPPLVYNSDKNTFRWLRESGIALAAVKDEEYPSTALSVNEADLFILYTDGLTEARHNHQFFGEEGIVDTIKEIKDQSAQEIADNLAAKAVSFSENILLDDVLILLLKKIKITTQGNLG